MPQEDLLLPCARSVAALLPGRPVAPPELAAFSLPQISQGSLRYLAQSLLGYEFLRKGFMAEAVVDGSTFQIFLLIEDSDPLARKALERYAAQISAKVAAGWFEGNDQLYGKVIARQQGRYVAGAVRLKNAAAARKTLEELLQRVAR